MPEEPDRRSRRPFADRVNPSAPGQVGRRPPQPIVPIVSGLMWIIVGVAVFIALTASWKWAVGIVCIGIGLLFLRGGLAAFVRQTRG